MLIETQQLTKYYGKTRGIEDVDLKIEKGEIFGFLGPNGSGKTTMIRLLLNLIRPTSGSAKVFGLDTQRHALRIHARAGYIPGELSLYPGLTGNQIIQYLANLRGGVDQSYVESLIERLDLDVSVQVKHYSSGNKHKIGLIQALMHQPDLLILDEPTIGLDPLIRQQFYSIVREAQESGQTVFLSSHNLSEIEHICQRVGIIRYGQLIAVEEISELKAEAYRRVEIIFENKIPEETFASLSSTENVERTDNRLRFRVSGNLDEVIKTAAQFDVIDMTSEMPGLEEIFLQFYGEDNVQDNSI